ncbi:uncharacterized protein A1O9_10289 [Exophiala aquamarina CBS 119918]|uniref:Lysophospholipase n=1 Tax=Exophiala aquamarina CBS 119918 TaxID=1182545 RepID=A0A072P2G2_9EURO|nr:uncharacterized protein A1O9_10289 [Exophiala aquamarina CBS 119918]KEF53887.1 hypothetical protein A1O9_10289 [Exophiala aquamarina CBS 119918]
MRPTSPTQVFWLIVIILCQGLYPMRQMGTRQKQVIVPLIGQSLEVRMSSRKAKSHGLQYDATRLFNKWVLSDASAYINGNADNVLNLPNIAIAASGGGYRAMLNGAGVLAAFDSRTENATGVGKLGGILQSSTYFSGLSGGSWLVGSIYVNNFTSVQAIQNDNTSNLWNLEDSIIQGPSTVSNYYAQLLRAVEGKTDAGFNDSITTTRPAAPNFFVEGKSAQGRADVAKRQALIDGAMGARAMHQLQNYKAEEPKYDNKARSFSATYHVGTGTLQLYAHHLTKPLTPGGEPESHMTQTRSFAMTDTAERFRGVDGETFRPLQAISKRAGLGTRSSNTSNG